MRQKTEYTHDLRFLCDGLLQITDLRTGVWTLHDSTGKIVVRGIDNTPEDDAILFDKGLYAMYDGSVNGRDPAFMLHWEKLKNQGYSPKMREEYYQYHDLYNN